MRHSAPAPRHPAAPAGPGLIVPPEYRELVRQPRVEQARFAGGQLVYGELELARPIARSGATQVAEASVGLYFSLEGGLQLHCPPEQLTLHAGAGQHNVLYQPAGEAEVAVAAEPARQRKLVIRLEEAYFQRLLRHDDHLLAPLATGIAHRHRALLTPASLPITPAMHAVIRRLLGCDKVGALRELFLESRVLELLGLQLEQAGNYGQRPAASWLSAYDQEQLRHAKALVESNLAAPLSLRELAKAVGLNEFKLKKGFKALFNTTVYGLLHELRMQQARHLLLDCRLSVEQVAETVGYAYPHHFSAAFKKTFGVLPSTLRR